METLTWRHGISNVKWKPRQFPKSVYLLFIVQMEVCRAEPGEKNVIDRTEQAEWDRQNGAGRTGRQNGQAERDRQNETGRMGKAERDKQTG